MATLYIPPPDLHDRIWAVTDTIAKDLQAHVTLIIDMGVRGHHTITIDRRPEKKEGYIAWT